MKCLDTYALVEIRKGNKIFLPYLQEDFILAELTLVEFYWVLLREEDESVAEEWLRKLQAYSTPVSLELMAAAMLFRKHHRNKNLSFFDCVGYLVAQQEQILFVTGDKEFERMAGVEFIK